MWTATGARPGLRRTLLLSGTAALAVVLVGGWLLAKQQATSSARREMPAALARLGLTGTVSYAGLTASPAGSVTLGRVTWKDGRQVISIDSITVSDLADSPDGLSRANINVRGMATPVGLMRDSLPAGLGKMLLGLGYVSPPVDVDASFDLDDSRRMLSADVAARSARRREHYCSDGDNSTDHPIRCILGAPPRQATSPARPSSGTRTEHRRPAGNRPLARARR